MNEFSDWPPLEEIGRKYIEKMFRHFLNLGGSFLDYTSERWRGLFEPVLWYRTEQEGKRLHEIAVASRKVETSSFVESGAEGRVMVITVAPSSDNRALLQSFPNKDYCQFYRIERRRLREVNAWESRDFVHWMFLWDEDELNLHLLYQISLKTILSVIGWQVKKAQERGEHEPYSVQLPPRIIPESLVEIKAFQSVAEELYHEERDLFFNR